MAVFAKDDQWLVAIDYIGFGSAPTPLSPRLEQGPAFQLALSHWVPVQ